MGVPPERKVDYNAPNVLPAAASTSAPTYTEGNAAPLSTDLSGNLRTVTGSGSQMVIVDGSGAGQADVMSTAPTGTEEGLVVRALNDNTLVDNAGFTDGTSRVGASGFIFDETAGTALTENDIGAARMDSKRAQVMVIEDTSLRGRRVQVNSSNALKIFPGSASFDLGKTVGNTYGAADTGVLVVGQDPATGNYAALQIDAASGAAHVSTYGGGTNFSFTGDGLLAGPSGTFVMVTVYNSYTGTLSFASSDTSQPVPLWPIGGGAPVTSVTDATGVWVGPVAGGGFYVAMSGYGSGQADVSITSFAVPPFAGLMAQKNEDQVALDGETGVYVLSVRQDTPGGSTADGDYQSFKTDSVGRLWVNGSGVTQPVSGTVTIQDGGNVISIDDNSSSITVDGSVTANPTRPSTCTTTSVNDNAASVTLLSANANRLGASVSNDSSAALYIKCGTTASTTDYDVRLVQYAYWECPFGYTGRVDAIWASDPNDGAARCAEYTA